MRTIDDWVDECVTCVTRMSNDGWWVMNEQCGADVGGMGGRTRWRLGWRPLLDRPVSLRHRSRSISAYCLPPHLPPYFFCLCVLSFVCNANAYSKKCAADDRRSIADVVWRAEANLSLARRCRFVCARLLLGYFVPTLNVFACVLVIGLYNGVGITGY